MKFQGRNEDRSTPMKAFEWMFADQATVLKGCHCKHLYSEIYHHTACGIMQWH